MFSGTFFNKLGPRFNHYWVVAEIGLKPWGLCGRVFVAAAAVILLIDGWTWTPGIMVFVAAH